MGCSYKITNILAICHPRLLNLVPNGSLFALVFFDVQIFKPSNQNKKIELKAILYHIHAY